MNDSEIPPATVELRQSAARGVPEGTPKTQNKRGIGSSALDPSAQPQKRTLVVAHQESNTKIDNAEHPVVQTEAGYTQVGLKARYLDDR